MAARSDHLHAPVHYGNEQVVSAKRARPHTSDLDTDLEESARWKRAMWEQGSKHYPGQMIPRPKAGGPSPRTSGLTAVTSESSSASSTAALLEAAERAYYSDTDAERRASAVTSGVPVMHYSHATTPTTAPYPVYTTPVGVSSLDMMGMPSAPSMGSVGGLGPVPPAMYGGGMHHPSMPLAPAHFPPPGAYPPLGSMQGALTPSSAHPYLYPGGSVMPLAASNLMMPMPAGPSIPPGYLSYDYGTGIPMHHPNPMMPSHLPLHSGAPPSSHMFGMGQPVPTVPQHLHSPSPAAALAPEPAVPQHHASPPTPKLKPNLGRWTAEEDELLRNAVATYGAKQWRLIAECLAGRRSDVQCLHRWQKVLRPGLVKGAWTAEEDAAVISEVKKAGGIANVRWSLVARAVGGRIGKQCRERWFNHLNPDIKKGPWSEEEDRIIFEQQAKFGNKWCEIAKLLPGRTENAVKNRFHSSIRRQVKR